MKFKRRFTALALLFCTGAALPPAGAAPPAELDKGRQVYTNCVGCHQPEGWGTADGAYPQIAGQHERVLLKQLADFKARNRDAPIMYPFADLNELDSQDMSDVVAYIASMPMTRSNGVGPGNDLEHGRSLYHTHCRECHGAEGQGNEVQAVPLIHGQHFAYLERQVEWIRSGKRRAGQAEMGCRMAALSPKDTTAVMDYVSRLHPEDQKLAGPGWSNPDFPEFVRAGLPVSERVCKLND